MPSDLSLSQNYSKVFLLILIVFGICLSLIYFLPQRTPVVLYSKSFVIWSKVEERVTRPPYVNKDHAFCGPCPTDRHLSRAWQLVDLLNVIEPENPFLVNIGAASVGGGQYDPTYPILSAMNSSYAALLIDPNRNPALFNAYPVRKNIQIKHDYIWSETVVEEIFVKNQVKKEFALLKIDIDSYECSVVESILRANYRPDVIHTEFNPIFPPPIFFAPLYNSTTKNDWNPPLWASSGPFYGCSLSALTTILSKFDYVLLEVEFWDVIFIRSDIAQSNSLQIPENERLAYDIGFLGHSCSSYCRGNSKLFNKNIARAIETNSSETLFSVIESFAPKSVKNPRQHHPFILKFS